MVWYAEQNSAELNGGWVELELGVGGEVRS